MTEFAWLIEVNGEYGPIYWDGGNWSSNHMRAVRFVRSIDADRVMINLSDADRIAGMRSVEHGWTSDEIFEKAIA